MRIDSMTMRSGRPISARLPHPARSQPERTEPCFGRRRRERASFKTHPQPVWCEDEDEELTGTWRFIFVIELLIIFGTIYIQNELFWRLFVLHVRLRLIKCKESNMQEKSFTDHVGYMFYKRKRNTCCVHAAGRQKSKGIIVNKLITEANPNRPNSTWNERK